VNSGWSEVVRRVVGGERWDECTVFLAPERKWRVRVGGSTYSEFLEGDDEDESAGEVEAQDRRVKELGLAWDRGRECDVDMIQSTCDVPRSKEYYLSRMGHTTVLRPSPLPSSHTTTDPSTPTSTGSAEYPSAVSWIMTHSDGALGALYTLPSHRRQGLARLVTKRRLREMGKQSPITRQDYFGEEYLIRPERGFCFVFKGNEASERLWEGMGWERGWDVRWVFDRNQRTQREEGVDVPRMEELSLGDGAKDGKASVE